MSTTTDKAPITDLGLLSELIDVARNAVDTQLRVGRDYVELAGSALGGHGNPTAAGTAYVESAGKQAVQYWRDVAELGVTYAKGVADLGNLASATVLAAVTEAVGGSAEATDQLDAPISSSPSPTRSRRSASRSTS